ncbi:unnamed protein product, partial [Discosporangium mesarthrocarpum]
IGAGAAASREPRNTSLEWTEWHQGDGRGTPTLLERAGGRERVRCGGVTGGGGVVAVSADDFLPLFTLILVHIAPKDFLVSYEMLVGLTDPEERLSEEGYLLATLQAAVTFVMQVGVAGSACGG